MRDCSFSVSQRQKVQRQLHHPLISHSIVPLKNWSAKPWYWAAFISWGIAFFEYILQVPANRIGYTALTLPQLKILQEVITLAVFVPFSMFNMRQPLKLDSLWAALCLLGAVYFTFRGTGQG